MKYIGSHVTASGGAHIAVDNSVSRGADTFAFFLSSPRRWKDTPLTEEGIAAFNKACADAGYRKDKILPHGNYLINIASGNKDIYDKSIALLLSEVTKCNGLGVKHYNLHPGSATTYDREDAIKRVGETINQVHQKVQHVVILLENTAGQGNVLGKSFDELANIISVVKDKSRIAVCLDTCHLFAAGYNIARKVVLDEILCAFDTIVGREYLVAFHLNDSLGDLGSHKDRHANLGEGRIGWDCFKNLMERVDLDELIFITETPGLFESSREELKKLRSFWPPPIAL